MKPIGPMLVRWLKPAVERFPRLATALRRWRDNRRDLPPVRTPQGFLLQGNPIMEHGGFEPNETRLVTTLLRDVDVLVNIGANIGYYACFGLQAGKHVIAFEPMPGNLFHLMRNLRHNGWQDRAEVFPMALSDRSGVIEIYGGGVVASLVKGWARVPESYVSLVPVHTADNVLGQRLVGRRCFVLVDVEGAENQVLAGAGRLLGQEPRPVWLVEISVNEHLPGGLTLNPALVQTFDHFFARRYRAWAVGETLREISRDEVAAVAASGRDTLLTHNFLFAADAQTLADVLPH